MKTLSVGPLSVRQEVQNADDGERALRMVKALDTAVIRVNAMLTGCPQNPVRLHKMSSAGLELGTGGLWAYCEPKSGLLGYNTAALMGWAL